MSYLVKFREQLSSIKVLQKYDNPLEYHESLEHEIYVFKNENGVLKNQTSQSSKISVNNSEKVRRSFSRVPKKIINKSKMDPLIYGVRRNSKEGLIYVDGVLVKCYDTKFICFNYLKGGHDK